MRTTLIFVCLASLCFTIKAAPTLDSQSATENDTQFARDLQFLICLTDPSTPECTKDANINRILDKISNVEKSQSKRLMDKYENLLRKRDRNTAGGENQNHKAQKRPSFYSDWK